MVRAALPKLFDQEAEHQQKLALLEAKVQKGLRSIKAGRVMSSDEVCTRVLSIRRYRE